MRYIFFTIFAMLSLCACGTKQSNNNNETMNKEKSIVVFFSHAGENYSVGNIKEGNTKLVADIISEQTGADRLEIICLKDYNMAYGALCDLAKEEQQNGELPGFTLMMNGEPVEGIVNFDDYTTVYIGGPVWWGTYPQVMFSFFKQYDLNDKTILPFTTHEGSGLGSCVSDLKKIYSKAAFGKAFSLYGHEVRTEAGREKVENWIK
ncbi:MAG: flavodoxin [Prevotella sp.]|nr:flavodoxin [Prevotella sp.]